MENLWQEIQHVLLLGTGRTSLSEKARQELRKLGLTHTHTAEAIQLLSGLSLLHFLRRGASQLPELEQLPAVAPAEVAQLPTPQLSRLVERILEKEELRPILSEYIDYSASAGLLLPPESLAFLFEEHKADIDQVLLIREVMGERGEWLARQNPAWAIFSSQSDEEVWQYGSEEERISFFSGLRQKNPEWALDLLADSWPKESRQQQLRLLSHLLVKTNTSDLSFLENCLASRDQAIRQLSAKILMTLPDSAFAERLRAIMEAVFYLENGIFTIRQNLPDQRTATELGFFSPDHTQPFDPKEKDSFVRHLIRLAPPKTWEMLGDLPPGKAFEALQQSNFYGKVRFALAESIHLHQDTAWMRVFLPAQYDLDHHYWQDTSIERLASHLPYEVFSDLTTHYLKFHNNIIGANSLILKMLMENIHFWPVDLSLRIVQVFQDYLRYSKSFLGGDEAVHYEGLLLQLALKTDTALLMSLQVNWPQDSFNWYRWESSVKKLLNILSFRAKMMQAFGAVE